MLLLLVRLALALQSANGCQDLIKLITAVKIMWWDLPSPTLSPLAPLKNLAEIE